MPGFYLVAIYWDYFGDNAYHFTLDSVVVYFDNDEDNLPDPGVALINNTVSTKDNGTRYSILVKNAAGNYNLGTFNVDITLRASGPDGTPHSPTDNHPIYYTILQSLESFPPAAVLPGPVTVRVLGIGRDMAVAISPLWQSGPLGTTLVYTVWLKNMGSIAGNYTLAVADTENWGPALSENQFENVQPDENRIATLSVIIPENAVPCTEDNITVTAISQENAEVSGSESVQVTAVRGVEVSVSPSANGGPPGERLAYIATVKNIGNTWDNYYLTKTDVLGWLVTENFAWIPLAPDNSASVSFEVFIPENAEACTMDIITITATSEENADVSDNDSCIARAIPENAFALDLVAGWNLVGFHHVSENDTPWNLFDGIEHYVWYLRPGWKLLGDSEPFELGVGYWIWLASATTVTVPIP